MLILRDIILLLALGVLGRAQAKRYTIMDNDWGTTGFVPFLIALNGGMEVLGLVSGIFLRSLFSLSLV